eukprot:CAMPEP_0202957380 /NCGR_PEP_ID=MMETSP1396-20130829/1788_1 /ASSEMBLY_ACC=CAM_ASM_000872 /TAXON_ID= /ORGANISM="Pseudokeronopsis sp., Strain Brazil" /LENGTH=69 /DNA_ID=CAMNT_0049674827 /DNA_START=151 /DNA_END=360 /DNA_ORIENTATION=-
MPIEDDIARRVERVDSSVKYKEKMREAEYLTMVSSEMVNSGKVVVKCPRRTGTRKIVQVVKEEQFFLAD